MPLPRRPPSGRICNCSMFFPNKVTRKGLIFTAFGLLNLIVSVPASTDPKDLPNNPIPDPGPPVLPESAGQAWAGIIQWTSLGDSYATGVGVGESKGFNRCVHYSDSYPLLMNKDSRMPGAAKGRRIWDCTCSGASTQDILDHQFLDAPSSDSVYGARSEFGFPQIATLTAGGDDIEFLSLVLECILQMYPFSNPCEEQIQRSASKLDDPLLFNSLDLIIKQILIRGITSAGEGFRLFVTGYAQFFNEKTDQCDDATFSYWDRGDEAQKLTKDLRQKLNKLARDLNNKIKAVVDNNKQWGVVYVDYDAQFDGHRYCEDGITEPDNNNPNIWFFHLGTDGNGRTKAFDDQLAAKLDPDGNKENFYARLKDPSAPGTNEQEHHPMEDAYELFMSAGEGDDITIQSGHIRIFHPTRPGIDAIVSQIFKAFPSGWPKPDVSVYDASHKPSPQPHCELPEGGKNFDVADATAAIDEFCGDKAYWPYYLVSPVSHTASGSNPKVPGFTRVVNLPNRDKVVLQLAFDQGKGCMGFFKFTGADGDSKCRDRFTAILSGCDRDNEHVKHGGYLEDICAVYRIGVFDETAKDPFPLKDKADLGAFQCKDTDTTATGGTSNSLSGTCTCWFEKLQADTELFDLPEGTDSCESIKEQPEKVHGDLQRLKVRSKDRTHRIRTRHRRAEAKVGMLEELVEKAKEKRVRSLL
ncbi:MAG: hypothetical protein Q9213_004059 [Squamulea squamosa]